MKLPFLLLLAASAARGAVAQAYDGTAADYALFSRFSLAQRIAVFPTLDAATKSGLWRRHLELYLEAHPRLSAHQWSLIQDARDLLTPELFADLRWPGSPEFERAAKPVYDIALRARDLFTEEEWSACFGRIGPADPRRNSVPDRGPFWSFPPHAR